MISRTPLILLANPLILKAAKASVKIAFNIEGFY